MIVTAQSHVADRLLEGEMTISGRLVDASNTTLFADLLIDGELSQCIYKPISGERPLWDFPVGTLANREVATFLLADKAGLDFVPPTALRVRAPLGEGMVQQWLPDADYHTLVRISETSSRTEGFLPVIEARDANGTGVVVEHADHPTLQDIALFDLVVNNADRKGGHVFVSNKAVYGVDHGLTWHIEPKVRTVLWGWAGAEFNARNKDLLLRLLDALGASAMFEKLLGIDEIEAARARAQKLMNEGRFPTPQDGEPNIPWPVF